LPEFSPWSFSLLLLRKIGNLRESFNFQAHTDIVYSTYFLRPSLQMTIAGNYFLNGCEHKLDWEVFLTLQFSVNILGKPQKAILFYKLKHSSRLTLFSKYTRCLFSLNVHLIVRSAYEVFIK
jgi:hypothetical protein